MTHLSPAEWQLPRGVARGLWDYLHDEELARNYDASVAESALTRVDGPFAELWLDPPGALLDLGCGTGRLAIDFARRGFAAVGVDLSAPMLRIAGEKARGAAVKVHRVQSNMVELDCFRDGVFDHAACLFSTLGMVQGAEARERVIEHVHRVLKPGGRFVLHVHNRWFNLRTSAGRRWLARDLLRTAFRHPEAGDCRMPVHQGIAGLTLHLFTRREVVHLLRRQRFRLLSVQPVSLRSDGKLSCPYWFGRLRAYGYLIAAEKMR
jgi:SAM-dependent methyltransferase